MPVKLKASDCAIQVASEIEGLDPLDLEPFARLLDAESKRLNPSQLRAIAEAAAGKLQSEHARLVTEAVLTKEKLLDLSADVIRNNLDDLTKGIQANLVGISLNRAMGRRSAGLRQLRQSNRFLRGFSDDMESAGSNLMHDFRKDIYQDDVIEILSLMDPENPPDLSRFHPDAIKIAEVMRKWDIETVDGKNANGANIKFRWDYSVGQYFDGTKLTFASEVSANQKNWRQMIGGDFSKRSDDQVEASWRAWWADEREALDMVKMEERFKDRLDEKFGPELTPERQAGFEESLEGFMRNVWLARARGLHLANSPSSSFDAIVPGGRSLATRLSEGRIIHYKSGVAFAKLFRKYGRGGLHDVYTQHLDMSGRHIGLMEKMGPNPELTFKLLARNMIEFAEQNDMPQQALKIRDATKRGGRLERQMDELTGAARVPVNRTMATVSGHLRAFQNMAKLGSVVFSAIDDIEFAASELQFGGRSFIDAHVDVVSALFRNKNAPETRRILAMIAPSLDSMRMGSLHRITTDDGMPGMMAGLQGLYFKLNFLTPWTDNFKSGLALGFAGELAHFKGATFKGLPEDLQRVFTQYGIDPKRWDIYRKSVQKDANGNEFIAADDFDLLADNLIEPLVQAKVNEIRSTMAERLGKVAKGQTKALERLEKLKKQKRINRGDLKKLAEDIIKASDLSNQLSVKASKIMTDGKRQIKRILDTERRDLAGLLRDYYTDRTERGVITPDSRVRSFIRFGTRRGTGAGTAVEFLTQFRSFTAAVTFGPLARELFGRQTDRSVTTIRQALINSPGKFFQSGIFMAAFMTARLTAIAYVSLALKDIARGRKPRLPTDPEKWKQNMFAAMAQGGGVSFLGDIMFGEFQDRYGENPLSQLAGPTLGAGADIINLYTRARDGDSVAADSIRIIQQNAPFINLFYTRLLFDYLIFYNMREMMDPGFMDRVVSQSKQDNSQEFIFPPNRAIPRGGGSPLEILGNIGENIGEG